MSNETEQTVYAGGEADEIEKTQVQPPDPASAEETLPGEDPVEDTAKTNETSEGRTGFAQEGLRISVLFAHRFGKHSLGSPTLRHVRLHEPGISTEGGIKARQSIVLVPEQKDRGTTVIGWLDASRRTAEIRSYEIVTQQHFVRHKAPFDVGKEEYAELAVEIGEFMRANQVELEVRDRSSREPRAREAREWRLTVRSVIALVMALIGLGVSIGVIMARGCH